MIKVNILDDIRLAHARSGGMTLEQFLYREIRKWQQSGEYKEMKDSYEYYKGNHDILQTVRTAIGKGGQVQEVRNLPNNTLVHNVFAKAVDQKKNYLFSKPLTFESDNEGYIEELNKRIFDNRFKKLLKSIGSDSIVAGIGYVHPYYDEGGKLKLKRFRPLQILPFWTDEDHTILDSFCRVYRITVYENNVEKSVEKVDYYTKDGISHYVVDGGRLIEDVQPHSDYAIYEGTSFAWERVPLIAFKSSEYEQPLLSRCKGLQDALNKMHSNFINNMEEDSGNSILVIRGYDGQDLGEFRRNLSTYRTVKVSSVEGDKGGVESLKVEVNSTNYELIIKLLKEAIIDNTCSMDSKDDKLGGNPNQMNIQSMYFDIDLDANDMESEYQASFEELMWFVNNYLGYDPEEPLEVIFNRDIMINESIAIDDCLKSMAVLSRESIVAQHPWVTDAGEEMARIKSEEQAQLDSYYAAVPNEDLNE